MHGRQTFFCAALLAIGTRALSAQGMPAQQQQPQPIPAQPATTTQKVIPVLGFTVGSASIDSAPAARSQVDDRSFGLQLDAGVLMKRHLYLGVDVGGQFLKDHAQFTQNTTGGKMKSTATVTYVSPMVGVRTGVMPGLPLALALNVGHSLTFVRRSIDNCSDCHVEKMDIPAGTFVEPALLIGRGNTRARIAGRSYLTGDGIRNVVSAGAELQIHKR